MFMNAVEFGSQVAQSQGATKVIEMGAEKGEELGKALFGDTNETENEDKSLGEKVLDFFTENSIAYKTAEIIGSVKEDALPALTATANETENEDKSLGEKVFDFLTSGVAFKIGEKLAENITK